MARPIKLGLSYFPLDVDIDQDDKISVIEAIHGIEGFGVLIKLFMKIYKEGYYYNWSEREQLLFSRRVNVDINSAKQIVSDSLDEKIFDRNLYLDYGILTSAGIQKRYLEAVTRRKEVTLEKRYLLINPHEYVGKTAKIKIKILDENGLEPALDGVNVDINDNLPVINDDISTQRREEKNKEEENKRLKEKGKKQKPKKNKYAEFVTMTEEEFNKLVDAHGRQAVDWMIEKLDNHKGASGKTYKSDYRAVLTWVVAAYEKEKGGTTLKMNKMQVLDAIGEGLEDEQERNFDNHKNSGRLLSEF